MQFEWDAKKNQSNRIKHGVDFETAVRVFDDPAYLLVEDQVDESREQRWRALGLVASLVLLVVVHVYRKTDDDKEIIRIISARKANQKESRTYFG